MAAIASDRNEMGSVCLFMTSRPCAESPPLALLEGIAEFNRGEFFECHETLEAQWMAESRPIRHLYQGILQIGVAFLHLAAGRYRPVVTLLERGRGYLAPFSPTCMGVNVAQLLVDAGCCLDEVQRLGPGRLEDFDLTLIPSIEMRSNT